jgi:hypothetical protein
MRRRTVLSRSFISVALCLGGCATLDHGTIDDVAVVTDPPGARVVSSSGTICISPCAVSGPRLDTFSVTITKPGYVTQTASSEAKPDADAIKAASALKPTADALGRVVDVQDGSYYRHEPKAIVVKLEPAG